MTETNVEQPAVGKEEEKKVTEPVAETPVQDKPQDKPAEEPKYRETPEDVEKARAYHQQKAQEETEKRKALEEERDALIAELDAADPNLNWPVTGTKTPADATPEKEKVEAVPEFGEEVDPVTRQLLTEVSNLRQEVQQMSQAQQVNDRQQEERIYNAERSRAVKMVQDYAAKHNIPKDVLEACDREAATCAPPLEYLGSFTKWGKLVLKFLSHHELQSSIQKKTEAAKADATAQLEHNKVVQQPSGAAVSPPAPEGWEERNRKEADEIVPDDPPVE